MSERTVQLDLRAIPVFERHPRIFDAWDQMEPGETLQIINDHDPKPLHYQFEGEYPDAYRWEYVKKDPLEWVVNIKKLQYAVSTAEALSERVRKGLDEVRPYLQADGGDVELVDIDEVGRRVTVRLKGACGGCPSAGLTLKAGVKKAVMKYAPEIKEVQAEGM